MVTAEELRDRIDKLAQKAEELLLQGDHKNARAHQKQVKILQKRLDDLTGADSGPGEEEVRSCFRYCHLQRPQGSMASSAANTAALVELNQTMVNLTPTFHQLVVTLTPKPEACKQYLSVAPSSATSGSGGQARQIQRRLGYQFVSNNRGPDTSGDLPDVSKFEWAAFRAEDHAAFLACEHLQVHFAPTECTVIAVQRVPWLEEEWDFPDAHLHIKKGKTDYLFVWTGQGAEELLEDIQQSQVQLELWQEEKTEAVLAKEQLEGALEEEIGMARKRSRPSRNIQQAREEQLEHELQEKKQLISQLEADIKNTLSRLTSCVGQLMLHSVGFYEAKTPSNLSNCRKKHRIQTELCWIVLNTKQHNAASEHPGAAAVLGDFNRHDIYCQPDNDAGDLSEPLCIEILSSLPSNRGRAAAARHIRQLLQSSVDELEARQDWIFEARPSGASTPQEAQLLARDVPGPSGGEATVQGIGERSPSPSSPQTAPMTDHELHCSAEIAAALQDHLSKPHVYEALGHTAPPSIPVSAVEEWLNSAWIVARS